MKVRYLFAAAAWVALAGTSLAQRSEHGPAPSTSRATRWHLAGDGDIAWNPASKEVHRDFIEMAGEQIAFLIRYGVDANGVFAVNHTAIWPMLRFKPNLTESHLRVNFGDDGRTDSDVRFGSGISYGTSGVAAADFTPPILVREARGNFTPLPIRTLQQVHLRGIVRFDGVMRARPDDAPALAFHREVFPSIDKPLAFDTTVLTNVSSKAIELIVGDVEVRHSTPAMPGIYGAYDAVERVDGTGVRTLAPGQSTRFTLVFEGRKRGAAPATFDVAAERAARVRRVEEIGSRLRLETPDPMLDTAFTFAKLRTSESIFRTKAGLMHAPGGGSGYYAAIWANDQAEYANPLFGLTNDPPAAESAINSFRHFARFMNPDYRAIPSSIIGEGDAIWNGAGDRGDMAMIAYGAGRFALAHGDRAAAEELWPLIAWCLEYSRRKLTSDGVVASDSDELEGRFPAGRANLSTSSLYYDALLSAAMLGRELDKPTSVTNDYAARAEAVREAIEHHFGATVAGFHTYRYYDKAELSGDPRPKVAAYASRPDALRSWIAMPLAMGIFNRRAGTIDALFSPTLWTSNGLATEAGDVTFWDRSTLYGLRGVLAAGDVPRGMEHLVSYTRQRLLGDHVPYPIEAYPENGMAQLAAESALYCRVFTEGLFGLRPTGLRSFTLTPRLPAGWPSMALRSVNAFGKTFDVVVSRATAGKLKVAVRPIGFRPSSHLVTSGETVTIDL